MQRLFYKKASVGAESQGSAANLNPGTHNSSNVDPHRFLKQLKGHVEDSNRHTQSMQELPSGLNLGVPPAFPRPSGHSSIDEDREDRQQPVVKYALNSDLDQLFPQMKVNEKN